MFYGLAWWAFLDEWIKVAKISVMRRDPEPSHAPPVGVIFILAGVFSLIIQPVAGIGLIVFGLLVMVIGHMLQVRRPHRMRRIVTAGDDGGPMSPEDAASQLQRMHTTRTVSREAIIAWYTFYRDELPSMYPARSEVDLIRTAALWMRLTDRGGLPGFPWDYHSAFSFQKVLNAQANPSKPNPAAPLGASLVLGGLGAFFVSRVWAVSLLIAGASVLYFGYKGQGGATNPGLMVPGSPLYEQEGRRVVEWAQSHRLAGVDPTNGENR